MKLTELLSGIETLQRAGAPETDITSLGFDSRHATAGQLFFAVKGSASDGHDYMAQATANGAAAVVCERLPEEPFPGVAYIVVADSSAALGTIASRFYGEPSHKLKLVGVTGTNGKTTTCSAGSVTRRDSSPRSSTESTTRRFPPRTPRRTPSASMPCWQRWRNADATTASWRSVPTASFRNASPG